jgi:hypothetical protein
LEPVLDKHQVVVMQIGLCSVQLESHSYIGKALPQGCRFLAMSPEHGVILVVLVFGLDVSCGDGALANATQTVHSDGSEGIAGIRLSPQGLIQLFKDVKPVEEAGRCFLAWHHHATKPWLRR